MFLFAAGLCLFCRVLLRIYFVFFRSLLEECIFLQTELVFWNLPSYFSLWLQHYPLDTLLLPAVDKNTSVNGKIVEPTTLTEISGHLQFKMLEDQVQICMGVVKLGMRICFEIVFSKEENLLLVTEWHSK